MTRSKNGALLVIMVRVHGDFTGRMAARSGKISKARSHLVVFSNPATNASNGGDDSQNDDFISLSRFELLE